MKQINFYWSLTFRSENQYTNVKCASIKIETNKLLLVVDIEIRKPICKLKMYKYNN